MTQHAYNHSPKFRLWRDNDNKIIAGVCSGIAQYFGLPRRITRIIAFIAFLFMPLFMLIAYLGLAWYLPTRPAELYQDANEQSRAEDIHRDPGKNLRQLKHRLHALERKLNRMEATVTDKNYQLRQKFRQL